MSNELHQSLRRAVESADKALAETKLAYEFNSNSYTYSAMSACITLKRELEIAVANQRGA